MLTKTITYVKDDPDAKETEYSFVAYTRLTTWRLLGILIYRITEPCPPTVAF